MKLNLILLLQLLCAIHKVSGSLHLSKSMAQRTENMLVNSPRVSQGSVATRLRCGGYFYDVYSKFSAEFQ